MSADTGPAAALFINKPHRSDLLWLPHRRGHLGQRQGPDEEADLCRRDQDGPEWNPRLPESSFLHRGGLGQHHTVHGPLHTRGLLPHRHLQLRRGRQRYPDVWRPAPLTQPRLLRASPPLRGVHLLSGIKLVRPRYSRAAVRAVKLEIIRDVSAKLEGSANNRAQHDNLDNIDGLARTAYERRIERLEQENKELSRKLVDTTKTLQEVVGEMFFYFWKFVNFN